MDAITLDHLLGELRPALLGRHLLRPRGAGRHALVLEVSGERERRLWLEAGRGQAGPYLLTRQQVRDLQEDPAVVPGRSRQALLLMRKHLAGARVLRFERIPGGRTLMLETSRALLVLRVSGAAPALSLVVDGAALATLGDGAPAWPLPEPTPELEWDQAAPERLAGALADAEERGRVRALLAACPGLGPLLAQELAGGRVEFEALCERLAAARPTLLAPGPPESWHDADLRGGDAVALAPVPLERPGRTVLHPSSWIEAGRLFLLARLRGGRFERLRREALDSAQRELRRLARLEAHLARDLAGLADTNALRRQAEALLACPGGTPVEGEADVPDPYEPGRRLSIRVDAALSLAANADRMFVRARRLDRARVLVDARLAETRRAEEVARGREGQALRARDLCDLQPGPAAREPRPETGGPRHYLTTRGLSLLVGRGARENHHITFTVSGPEDLWLHARDTAGAHVILRDPEGRASADDLREAAEVAAFFSGLGREARVDVHLTRRKHVRPARGGGGRVMVAHSDTLRAVPRDPEGRLRRRR